DRIPRLHSLGRPRLLRDAQPRRAGASGEVERSHRGHAEAVPHRRPQALKRAVGGFPDPARGIAGWAGSPRRRTRRGMTSTDCTYPQPTDDELAAQQPRSPSPHAPLIYSSPGAGLEQYEHAPDPSGAAGPAGVPGGVAGVPGAAVSAKSPTLGKTALVFALIGAVLTLAASAILAATIGPTEAASGYY